MNLLNIIEEELSSDEVFVIEEGLFEVSPAIAMFAFKDSVLNKLSKIGKVALSPVENAVGKVATKVEQTKAKTIGRSGNDDNDTVYSFTKEQKQAMAYIYKKYGPQLVNDIEKFRKDVMIPYSIVKRNVAKNKMITNKEILGMTKEDYYKYRESGRKKIEKKGSYFKDSNDLKEKQIEARKALTLAKEKLEDFKAGKIVDLTSTNIEKILDEAGIGRKELNGWTDVELEKTATAVADVMRRLEDPSYQSGENIRVGGKANSSKATYRSRDEYENYLKKLQERGYSYANDKNTDDGNHHGSFKDAFAIYMLRREKIREIKSNSLNSDFKKFYEKVLKDAIDGAQRIYDEKFNNYVSLKGTVELNQFEKKIWGLKMTGIEYSGDINDWYLKIKPEDFKETKYTQKSEKILKAEKDMDKSLKQLERKLKKVMSEEDLAMCRKYRLFNNFLTVKELRDSKDMFKTEIPKIESSNSIKKNEDNFSEKLSAAMSKEYSSIKELEDARNELNKEAKEAKLSKEDKEKLKSFNSRINPKNGSKVTKIDRAKINEIINKINTSVYTGKTQASDDLKQLNDVISDFRELYGEEELKRFEFDINKAKGKLSAFLNGGN